MSKPELHEVSITFRQDNGDHLTLSLCDSGDGPFWELVTERWEVDDLGEVVALFEKVKDLAYRGVV